MVSTGLKHRKFIERNIVCNNGKNIDSFMDGNTSEQ
jgi:hypothetical protein